MVKESKRIIEERYTSGAQVFHLVGLWIGLFTYVCGCYIGYFATINTVRLLTDDILVEEGRLYFNLIVMILLLLGSTLGLIYHVSGKIVKEVYVIPPVAIGLIFITVNFLATTTIKVFTTGPTTLLTGIGPGLTSVFVFYLGWKWVDAISRSRKVSKIQEGSLELEEKIKSLEAK